MRTEEQQPGSEPSGAWRLQHGVLLPELVLELGGVCWFHSGQNILLHSAKEPDADPGIYRQGY